MKKLYLFLGLFMLPALQAMEQPEKQPAVSYFKQLPLDLQKVIALYVTDAPTVKDAYTNMMNLLQVDTDLSSLRGSDHEAFMREFTNLLFAKVLKPLNPSPTHQEVAENFNNIFALARATNNKYILLGLKEWFDTMPIKDKQLFLQQYFQSKLDTKNFGDARFLLNNLHLFSKALENIPDAEKNALSKENKLEKWLLHLGLKSARENLPPLHNAIKRGDLDVVKFLINEGADINAKISKDQTPLSLALTELSSQLIDDRDAIAHYLIQQGADVNIFTQNVLLPTPLMLATFSGKPELVRELIRHGANIDARSDVGESALDVARIMDDRHKTNFTEILQEEQQKLLEKSAQPAEPENPSKEEVDDDLD